MVLYSQWSDEASFNSFILTRLDKKVPVPHTKIIIYPLRIIIGSLKARLVQL